MPERAPPQRFQRPPLVHTRDPETARQVLARVFGDLTLDLPRDGHRFEWKATPVDLGSVALFSGSIASSVIMRGEASGYMVRMAAGSAERAASKGVVAEVAPGRSAVVFSPRSRGELRTEGSSLPLTLRVDAGYLESQLEALTGARVPGSIAFALPMPTVDGVGSFLERLCQFVVAESTLAGPALAHPLVMASLGEAVTRALLVGQPHDHTHLLERQAPPSSRTVLRIVEEYIEAHAAEPIRTTDLTALVGASMASIDAVFRAHRGTTSMAFLRERRLRMARDRLLSPASRETVTDVAHASGFLRRETFDAAYTAEIGESPAETKRRGLLASEAPPPPSPRRATSIPAPAQAIVLVVHGDPGFRDSLGGALRKAGHEVRTFGSVGDFLAAQPSGGGCAVVDVQLAELAGLSPMGALREGGCALPVVLTSVRGDVRVAVEAMKAGAVDFLIEPLDEATALAAVARGLARDAEARTARAGEAALAARVGVLSPREREVCERVARGSLNKQIAADLGISESAVRLYRAKGMEKLGVRSAAKLARLLERLGSGA